MACCQVFITRGVALVTLLCFLTAALAVQAAPLDLKTSSTWEKVVFSAADAAVQAIAKQTGAELSLRDVPLETLQVFTGQQHHLGVTINGIAYEIALGGDKDFTAAGRSALPAGTGASPTSTQLALEQHWQQQQQSNPSALTLPDVTLSGPLELVLQEPGLVSFFVPHAADVGMLRRIRLGPGVTVKVAGLKSIVLRRPTDLPTLPIGYLVDVYAQARLGVPEQGFNKAPGLHFLAEELHKLALNSSTSLPLLSFEVAPAGTSLSITSTASQPGPRPPQERPPRLKVKRSKDGAVELTLPQVPAKRSAYGAPDSPSTADLASIDQLWAWPLPHVDMTALVPYETLLRSILAAHPFDLNHVSTHGMSIKLVKSEVAGVRMLGFEMEVRSRARQPVTDDEKSEGSEQEEVFFEPESEQLMVFEVVVQIVEDGKQGKGKQSQGGAGGNKGGGSFVGDSWSYAPLSVKLKSVHGSAMTMSTSAVAALLGNDTLPAPIGYESVDLGVAGQEE